MTVSPLPDRQRLAEACGAAMMQDDNASRGLGMRLDRIAPGEAELSMTVTETMTNGHKICHGGFIFTLADSAFAFACNSHNQRTVAQHCQISFLRPARLGDVLTARAVEHWRQDRSGIYDVSVRGAGGETVAVFRGHSRTIPGQLVDHRQAAGDDPIQDRSHA